MAARTLYAYVDGRDHEDVVATIEERLDALVAGRTWISPDVWVVNQRSSPPPGAKPGTPVDWDLGLNMTLAPSRKGAAGWIEDVLAIATALGALHRETRRRFVIGIHDAKTDRTNDLFVVETESPDLEKLRTALSPPT